MSLFKFQLGMILTPALLLAQLTNNTVTATASQTTSAVPDQAILSITVSSGATATLEQIVNALSSVGVTAANLSSVFGLATNVQWTWNFQLTVPLTQLEATTAAFTALEKSISQNNSGLSLSFYVSGTQLSGQASSNCNFAALLAQARTQAQQIASAASLQTGAITALRAATAACSLTATFAIPTLLAQPGPNTITIAVSGTNTPQNDQATIYLTVTSPVTADLSDVTSALTADGITGTNLTGVNSGANVLDWFFTFTVPFSKLTAALAEVASAAQATGNGNPGVTVTFINAYGSASQSQQGTACSQSTLISSALALAQQIATSAGVSVGPVLNIAEGGSGVATAAVANGLALAGNFISTTLSTPCVLTIQYQLL